MPQQHPYRVYQSTNVQTADQRQLILMLYDGAIRFLGKGAGKIAAGDMEGAHNYLVRSRQIVAELLATLRPEKAGEVGQNLKRLYLYCFNRIVEANLLKDAEIVTEVAHILETLREGWANTRPAARPPAEMPGQSKRINLRG